MSAGGTLGLAAGEEIAADVLAAAAEARRQVSVAVVDERGRDVVELRADARPGSPRVSPAPRRPRLP